MESHQLQSRQSNICSQRPQNRLRRDLAAVSTEPCPAQVGPRPPPALHTGIHCSTLPLSPRKTGTAAKLPLLASKLIVHELLASYRGDWPSEHQVISNFIVWNYKGKLLRFWEAALPPVHKKTNTYYTAKVKMIRQFNFFILNLCSSAIF